MRFAFVDPGPLNYDLDSPGKIPLGGSESAMCHLVAALGAAGHEVYFLKGDAAPHWTGKARCLPMTTHMLREVLPVDAVVVLNAAGPGSNLREIIGPRVPLVLWIHQAHDQPVILPLRQPLVRDAYTGFACVSRWQAEMFVRTFGLSQAKIGIMRNAVAPWFVSLFTENDSILAVKRRPTTLAYTSTPYRGLDVLIDVFPQIRSAMPGVTLQIFSSMSVYQMRSSEEQGHFGPLYERCRATPGVELRGSVSQVDLATALREVSVLSYPNTYAETSCISALEAMAAGCRVVSSQLAAIPETTAGHANLLPPPESHGDGIFRERFVAAVLEELTSPSHQATAEARLREQVAFIQREYTWTRRARDWCDWVRRL